MVVECPHVGIRELSEAWGVSARTVKEWLASAGIKTVVRGRYRVSDIARYAEIYGKPKFSKIENIELIRLKKENQFLLDKLGEYHKIIRDIFHATASGMIISNEITRKETVTR